MNAGSKIRPYPFYRSVENVKPPAGVPASLFEQQKLVRRIDRTFPKAKGAGKQHETSAVSLALVLWRKAVLANHIAKICSNPPVVYKRKGIYLSVLRRMGLLYFTEAQMMNEDVLLSAAFRHGGRIHIFLKQLDDDIQGQVTPVVARLLAASLNNPTISIDHRRNSQTFGEA